MRSLKAVMTTARNLILTFPSENENIILLRSIMNVNNSKLISKDIPIFEGILSDVFPGVILPKADHTAFTNAIEEVSY